ncbi:MAG: hypothetical protein AAGA00_13135 [Pseudomonadota bacterium]
MREFDYTHELQFDEQQYVEAWLELIQIIWPIRLFVILITAGAMLFWSYTMIIGMVLLMSAAMAYWLPARFIPRHWAESSGWNRNRFARQKTIYSADQDGYTVATKGMKIRINWEKTTDWKLTRNWLHINTRGFPSAWFRKLDLEQAGVYDDLMGTLHRKGVRQR